MSHNDMPPRLAITEEFGECAYNTVQYPQCLCQYILRLCFFMCVYSFYVGMYVHMFLYMYTYILFIIFIYLHYIHTMLVNIQHVLNNDVCNEQNRSYS